MRSALTCNGRFRIYEDGSICKITDSGEVPAKTYLNQFGYKFIHYNKRNLYVHRLVAMAFIENPGNRPAVNHIDGNKQNNDASNLEWVAYQENTMHAIRTGLMYPNHNVSLCSQCGEHYAKSSDGICYLCKVERRKKRRS